MEESKGRIIYLFAMEREAEMLNIKEDKKTKKFLIGINGVEMPETCQDDILINLGYCGAYKVDVGTIVEPKKVYDINTNDCLDIDHIFDCPQVECFTSDEFVTSPNRDSETIYDMELYKIAKLPHKALYSLKIVSDNLSEKDCEAYNDKVAWSKLEKILEKGLKKLKGNK